MRGVFLDLASLAEQDLDLSAFEPLFDEWRTFPATAPDQRVAHIGDAEVVVTNKVVVDDAVIRAAPNLKMIGITATGYNNIAIETAKARGIVVSNVVSDAATALYLAFAALKSALVNVNINLKFIKDEQFVGEWAAKVGNLLAETEAGYATAKRAIEAALEVAL